MEFWQALENLVAASQTIIDRPQGSAHPRYPDMIYPLDYGYLHDTHGGDGAGMAGQREPNAPDGRHLYSGYAEKGCGNQDTVRL